MIMQRPKAKTYWTEQNKKKTKTRSNNLRRREGSISKVEDGGADRRQADLEHHIRSEDAFQYIFHQLAVQGFFLVHQRTVLPCEQVSARICV